MYLKIRKPKLELISSRNYIITSKFFLQHNVKKKNFLKPFHIRTNRVKFFGNSHDMKFCLEEKYRHLLFFLIGKIRGNILLEKQPLRDKMFPNSLVYCNFHPNTYSIWIEYINCDSLDGFQAADCILMLCTLRAVWGFHVGFLFRSYNYFLFLILIVI